ncbi:HugZ family protein [Rhodopila sp.]|uniref:HugZ family pyridoxamine 5'-phosphate oxidase n=1 Tax=Rhodopila sp. TaxID=2480087 RepID=UPI003D12E555
MASEPVDEPPASPAATPAWQARCLLRAARCGTLATTSQGQPFASLTTPACMPDGSLLLLLSRLSEHTRHLIADPRCSVMVTGPAPTANPQTTPRVSITGVAEVVDDPPLKARYLAVHPYASLYADFTDFATWRIVPAAGSLVGGFARAFRLTAADLAPDAEAVAAILASEPGILSHCNRDHPAALAAIAGETGDWRMVTADVDGFDLALAERVIRIAWTQPVEHASDVRRQLVSITEQRRGG